MCVIRRIGGEYRLPISVAPRLGDSAVASSWTPHVAEVDRRVRLSPVRQWVPRGQDGQGLAEYALILGLVAVLAIAALTFMGGAISTMMSALGNAL